MHPMPPIPPAPLPPSRFWADLVTDDFAALDLDRAIAVLPVAATEQHGPHLPIGADKFAFTVFGDLGDAWNPGEPARLNRLRSVGLELVGDLTISYDLPLRLRVGVAQPATGQATVYGGFGADF